jgi:predicted site-specific integrase-resolvase
MSEISLLASFSKGAQQLTITKGTNCVIYTRVSTKEQADNNLSLETQIKACSQYAEKNQYNVLANFGGTYESVQNDEWKEFTSMLSYVKKSKEKVSYILVYSFERFSRNDNSIWLSGQLRKLGIEIVPLPSLQIPPIHLVRCSRKCFSCLVSSTTSSESKSAWPVSRKCY